MATNESNVQVNINARDNTEKAFKSAKQNASLFNKEVGTLSKSLKNLAGIAGTYFGIQQISKFLGDNISLYENQIQQEVKLEHLLKKTTDATNEQVDSLLEQAAALQEVGVVGDEVTIALQAQLATFELNTNTIKRMTPAILDMIVAEKGANATTQDMISFGNAFGMAMEGNYASLTHRGFKLDENTMKIIELGTEEQKAEAITKYLTDTYGGLNEQMAKTSQGGMQQTINSIGDLREEMGKLSSYIRSEIINDFSTFFSDTIHMSGDWAKNMASAFNAVREVALTVPRVVSGTGLGLGAIFEKVKSFFTGDESTYGDRLKDSAIDMIEGAFDWTNFEKLSSEFEKKWKKTSENIITPISEGGDNALPDLADDAEDTAKRIKSAFETISSKIVKSFEQQTKAVNNLREELENLDKETNKQLKTAEERYNEELKNRAISSRKRIEQIEKQIEEERKAMNTGWRTRIKELEQEKEKEQAIINAVGKNITNINSEIAKDELTILRESYDKEIAEIKSNADEKRKLAEEEINQRQTFMGNQAGFLTTEGISKLVADEQTFAGKMGYGQHSYVFNFNGDVNDKEALMKAIVDLLNRQSQLKQYSGE